MMRSERVIFISVHTSRTHLVLALRAIVILQLNALSEVPTATPVSVLQGTGTWNQATKEENADLSKGKWDFCKLK